MLVPEGGSKKVLKIVSSVIVLSILLSGIRDFDYRAYADSIASIKENEESISSSGEDLSQRLRRLVIQEEAESYIKDKAADKGLVIYDIAITAEWSNGGYWYPVSAEIHADEETKTIIEPIIEADLGIPGESQVWIIEREND